MRSLIILLLVAFVATSVSAKRVLDADPATRGCCGKERHFDLFTEGCCGGTVFNITTGQQCCGGTAVYDPTTSKCCTETVGTTTFVGVAAGLGTCCRTAGGAFVTFNSVNQSCCPGVGVFASPPPTGFTSSCCGGQLLRTGFGCCGNIPYDTATSDCCSNRAVIAKGLTCCTTPTNAIVGFNATTHICCSGVAVPFNSSIGTPAQLGCCGAQAYNFHSHGCCGNVVYDQSTQICCTNQVLNNTFSCCAGRLPFDPTNFACCPAGFLRLHNQTCCGNQPAPAGFSCCSGQPFNSTDFRCCGSSVIPILSECCLFGDGKGAAYNSTIQSCCANGPVSGGLGRLCCGSGTYDPATQVCCGDRASAITGLSIPSCCGNEAYDGFTSICCNGTLYEGKAPGKYFCCGHKKYNPLKKTCCSGFKVKSDGTIKEKFKVYKGLNVQCCGHKKSEGTGDACCGKKRYVTGLQVCCGGEVFDGNACCGDEGYNLATQLCCKNKRLYDVPNDGINACCGKKHYNRLTQLCCP